MALPPRLPVSGITIDGATSKDLDDGLSLDVGEGTIRVGVHIADVAGNVPRDGDLDCAARDQAFTRYFAAGNRPMFPRELSENRLSLHEGQPRDAMTCDLVLRVRDLALADFAVRRTRFTNAGRFDYTGADAVLAGERSSPHAQLLRRLDAVARRLHAARRAGGALGFFAVRDGWATDEEGRLAPVTADSAHRSHIIVQEFMILANRCIADWLHARRVPALFRNHRATIDSDRQSLLDNLAKIFAGDGADIAAAFRHSMNHTLERARYGPRADGHFGLNVPAYTHATSPIRRYADLVNQRILLALAAGDSPPYTADDLAVIAAHIHAVEDDIRDRQNDSDRYRAIANSNARRKLAQPDMLDDLNPTDFLRVIKVVSRENGFNEAFVAAFVRRLDAGQLIARDVFPVLFEGHRELALPHQKPLIAQLHTACLVWLRDQPERATALLGMAEQMGAASESHIDVESVGTPEAPSFQAQAAFAMPDSSRITGAIVRAGNKKTAKHLAAYNLIATFLGEPDAAVEAAFPADPAPPAPAKLAAVTPTVANENYVGALQEFAARTQRDMPDYHFTMQGESHAPVVTCECHFDGRVSTATAGTKKAAKHAAAQAMIDTFREAAK